MGPLILLTLVLVTYANSFGGQFLGDSGAVVLDDPRVHEITRDNLQLIFTQQYWYPTADSGVFRPLVTLSFLFNYSVLGNASNPAGYHWVNLSLHIVNVMLVWLLALTIWKQPASAFFTAAIFAVHPVNVESVTNIAGRADVMAGMGVLAGLVLYAYLPDVGWRRLLPWLAGIFLAALFGLFSKENAVILPAAMFLYDLVFRRSRLLPWQVSLSGYLAVVPALVTNLWVRHMVFSNLPPFDTPFVDNPLIGADFMTARLTALKVLFKQISLLLWPRSLTWDYSYNQIPLASWSIGLAALAGMIGLLTLIVWLFKRNAPACFFGAFFFLSLVPTSNLLLIIGSIMAERFLYLPSIGFAGCVVAGAIALSGKLATKTSHQAGMATAALALIVIGFGLRASVRNSDWADGERFSKSALETSPGSFKTHLAPIYLWSQKGLNIGNIDQAIGLAEQAVAIVNVLPPEKSTTLPSVTLGTLYRIKGDVLVYARPWEVQDWYRRSLQTLMSAVPIDQAFSQEQRRKAVSQNWPSSKMRVKGNAFLYQNLGDTYKRLGRFPEALEALSHLMKLTPFNSTIYSQISDVNTELRRPDAAIVALWQAFAVGHGGDNEHALMAGYRTWYPDSCAGAGLASSSPNPFCPLVRTHTCLAYEELVRVLTDTGRPEESGLYRETAHREYQCALK